MINKSKDSDELKAHREMYVAQCNKFGGLNLGVGVHYSAGWNDASEILDAVAKLCNEAELEVISIRVENARLRAALSDLLEFAIDSTCGKQHAVAGAREALKGQP